MVLCSDGLSDMLTSAEILEAAAHNAGDPRKSVRELIALANRAGGKDNISAIVVEGEDFAQAVQKHTAAGNRTDEGHPGGTRIFRDGRPIEVPGGNPRGVRLRPGDEIYLGQACVRISWELTE